MKSYYLSSFSSFSLKELSQTIIYLQEIVSQNMADKSEPEEQPRFLEGEKILCFHGPLIYEAKIQKVEYALITDDAMRR